MWDAYFMHVLRRDKQKTIQVESDSNFIKMNYFEIFVLIL